MNLDAPVCKPGGLALLCGNKSSRLFVHIAWRSTKELLSLLLPTVFPSFHTHLVAHLAQDPIKSPGGTPRLGSSLLA